MQSSHDLWAMMSVLRRLVFDQLQGELSSLGLDLTMPQSIALTAIAEAGPLTVSALQARLKRSQATTSHLVSQLELRGLVERADDADDARRTVLRLSRAGRRLLSRLEQLRRQSFERVMRRVPKAVRLELEVALKATLRALEKPS